MIDFKEYLSENAGKLVTISTLTEKLQGTLVDAKTDPDGIITALVLKQYLHRISVPVEGILHIRLV